MQPAERIRAISKCAGELSGGEWADIDFVLGQFFLPVANQWDAIGDFEEERKFNYVRDMLARAVRDFDPSIADERITDLHDYLTDPPGRETAGREEVGDHPWEEDGGLRIFLTHLAEHKGFAASVKNALTGWGFQSFVAHEDIEPGIEWQRMILSALRSCHALVAILHNGFRESNWCDQEVGIAFGRGVPILPLRVECNPHGFLGAYQAVIVGDRSLTVVVRELATLLVNDKRTAEPATDAIVERLALAWNFEHANRLSTLLAEHRGAIRWDHIDRLREAERSNSQVRDAYAFPDAMRRLESGLPPRPQPPAPPVYDEEPF